MGLTLGLRVPLQIVGAGDDGLPPFDLLLLLEVELELLELLELLLEPLVDDDLLDLVLE